MNTIYLAGGCFWGLQKFFDQFEGIHTQTGYINGSCDKTTYQEVCNGSGHAEAIKVDYPDSIPLAALLAAFFSVVDPVSVNRQGNDVGINYRSGIYSDNPEDLKLAKAMICDLQKHFDKPIAVETGPVINYIPAEDYHQKYLDANPYGYCHLPRNLMSGHRLPTLSEVEQLYPSVKPFYPAG